MYATLEREHAMAEMHAHFDQQAARQTLESLATDLEVLAEDSAERMQENPGHIGYRYQRDAYLNAAQIIRQRMADPTPPNEPWCELCWSSACEHCQRSA